MVLCCLFVFGFRVSVTFLVSEFRRSIDAHAQQQGLLNLNLYLNSLLVKRQIDNPSPGDVTGGN